MCLFFEIATLIFVIVTLCCVSDTCNFISHNVIFLFWLYIKVWLHISRNVSLLHILVI